MKNDLCNELSKNFIDYAYAVNCDRSIPDAKTGLKPVARRILWSALEEGRLSNKPHVKSARIVGDVMGRYHPHGDSSIYSALIRLSQNWIMRYPLIDVHGNNGNIAGDGPAASRYTEARLSKLAEEGLLNGIKKKNVDFIPNYDETLEEPITLPATFPNLLCNPNTGIGVAMACNWAPHNLNDVATAIYDYLDNKNPILPGPDFPTGGLIINKNDIPKIMETGHGTVKIRARYTIEKDKIIFYEIPYGTTIEGLITEVGDAAEKKEIEGISDIHDESSKKIRIVITCEKGVDPNIVVKRLYQKTNFQTSFSYNQVALINKTPTELNLKDAIKIYVDHNIECIVKECQFDLTKAQDRLEIVNGLLKALEDIDNIIALIKSSESAAAAKENLISRYNFTENQAKAILAMRLSSLAKLEKIELEKEAQDLKNKIFMLNTILDSRDEQIGVLKVRLQGIVNKFGDSRKTELTQIEENKEEKEKIEIIPEDVVVIVTHNGDIKRIPKKSFKVQHKKGIGVKTLDSATLTAISTNTASTLMLFSNKGKMYRLLVDKIPEGTNTSKGTNVKNLIPLDLNENIAAIAETNHKKTGYIIFITKNGLIKKTKIEEYINLKKNTGVQAIKLKENDSVFNVLFGEDTTELLFITKNGLSLRIKTDDIRPIGRLTSGVKGIALKEEDELISVLDLYDKANIAIITSKGKAKKMLNKEFIIQGRGGRGASCMKLEQGDFIAAAALVEPDSSLLIVGKPNSICVPASELIEQTKGGSGTLVIERSLVQTMVKL